jgi:uncharacterized protein (UPF0332 family)
VKQEDKNNIIGYRLEQAQIALDDAIYLNVGGRSPQSIVNRCYYAMFYATIALLQDIGKAPTKHSGIISLFDTEYVMKGIFPRKLSKDLHKAFELRQSSDYKVRPAMPEEQVKEEIEKASRFVEAVKSYFQQSS